MGRRRYRRIPVETLVRMREQWDAGALGKDIAEEHGIDAAYVSRLCRGISRASDPGPIGKTRKFKLSIPDQEALLDSVVFARKHYGAVSERGIARTLGFNRLHLLQKATRRADAWINRLFSYVTKGTTTTECWIWTGGTYNARQKTPDGTFVDVEKPRYMNSAAIAINPAKWLYEFATGHPVKGRLKQTCGNPLCVAPHHHLDSSKENTK